MCAIWEPIGTLKLSNGLKQVLKCDFCRIHIVELDEEKQALKLKESFVMPPGSGPRHMAYHPNGN